MRIALLTMPFLHPPYPSLALTQLKGRVKDMFKDQVDISLFYLNHEFYRYFGKELYNSIDSEATYTSLNDWVFHREAFDQVKSTFEDYVKRFYPNRQFDGDTIGKLLSLGDFIAGVIRENQLDSYDMVGINATFATLPGLAFARYLKKIKKEIITIMGGAAVSEDMGEALIRHYPYLDYVSSGPGLISFPRLIAAIMKRDLAAAESIDGIFSKNNTGKVAKNGEILDINENIPLDYDDFFASFHKFKLEQELEPAILMETSRGCYWNRCKFCGLNEGQKKYQVKKPAIAIAEINRYTQKYKCHTQMVDNIMPRSYLKEVLPHLQLPAGCHLMYEVKADYNPEEMQILNQAAVKRIQPGIETLATSVHETMNKGVNSFQCITMLKQCVQLGIIPGWNLIAGIPGMTATMYEELLAIIPLLIHLYPPTVITPVRFDRYSIYWQEKEKYDLDLVPFSTYQYLYPYGNEFLAKIAYYFEDINFNSERIFLMSKYYSPIETLVNNWKKRWKVNNISQIPRLTTHMQDGSPYIYDTRRETVKHYPISPLAERILNLLETPMSVDQVEINFPSESPANIVDTLNQLLSNGLIIKENHRYLGLVITNYSDDALRFLMENRR